MDRADETRARQPDDRRHDEYRGLHGLSHAVSVDIRSVQILIPEILSKHGIARDILATPSMFQPQTPWRTKEACATIERRQLSMPVIDFLTSITALPEICFDLARDVDLHVKSIQPASNSLGIYSQTGKPVKSACRSSKLNGCLIRALYCSNSSVSSRAGDPDGTSAAAIHVVP